MVGKKIGDSVVLSVEYQTAIVRVVPLFEQSVELRVGLLF